MAEALPGGTQWAKTDGGTRPLASPVLEMASFGTMYLIFGLAFGGLALGMDRPLGAAFEILFTSVFFGAWMYRFAYRRYTRRVVEELRAPPTAALESKMRTLARGAVRTALLAVALPAFAIWDSRDLPIFAGIVIGNGICLLLTSRWLRSWEKEHQSRLLREPRYRWHSGRRRGWGRGRGIFEPKDFYVVGSTAPGA